jgi:deoxyribodipyrimidine photo-lyase
MAASLTDTLKRRIVPLNKGVAPDKPGCVLYIMSRDQRVADNPALLAAQKHAVAMKLPLHVRFILYRGSGYRAREHFVFMLNGLKEVGVSLKKLNISFEVIDGAGDNSGITLRIINTLQPAAVYIDFNPLGGPRKLAHAIAQKTSSPVFQVDAHNVVPLWLASNKEEVGARTLRPKIHKLLPDFLHEPEETRRHPHGTGGDQSDYQALQDVIQEIPSNGQILTLRPGESAAFKTLENFIDHRLEGYAERRNDPAQDGQSGLSPYLHYGHISALRVALAAQEAAEIRPVLQKDIEAFLEELIVRRELSDNYCWFNKDYLSLNGAPEWAQKTLEKHASDQREWLYGLKQLEKSETHDSAWNAAQNQLVQSGKMHGYMRMYWAKKVLEWTETPQQAIEFLVELNDRYSIDGGDPNGYVGIMWSVAGVHDRPWGERHIYGTVRSMVYNGLKRKFDIAAYERQWL